jgi:hypothetical protein
MTCALMLTMGSRLLWLPLCTCCLVSNHYLQQDTTCLVELHIHLLLAIWLLRLVL